METVTTRNIEACLKREKLLAPTSPSARLDVELLLQCVLDKNRAFLYAWPEKELSDVQFNTFETYFQRRVNGEPIAHILGSQGFWSLDLDVSPCTLIPRPETELLVEFALEHSSSESRILDLGTGTGAIALALACELPSAEIHAVDLSSDAVALAKKNAKKHGRTNVKTYQSHWFEQVDGYFDLIISNPPYIEENDPHLKRGDLRYEPLSALVSGADGLDDIRAICRGAKNHLFESGILMFEHGWNQGERARKELAANGFEEIETLKDFGGKDRVSVGRFLGDAD